jgi:hypothetical protein
MFINHFNPIYLAKVSSFLVINSPNELLGIGVLTGVLRIAWATSFALAGIVITWVCITLLTSVDSVAEYKGCPEADQYAVP